MFLVRRIWFWLGGVTVLMAACSTNPGAETHHPAESETVTVTRGSFVRQIRATGTTEAVLSATTLAPRLAGQQSSDLIITRLVAGGTRVRPGDVLVEFDRQTQVQTAHDRRAEFLDLEQQILKKQAEQAASRAADDTTLTVADHDVGRARLDVEKNQFLSAIDAEKNTLALEQATARLTQLRQGALLKARSAAAEIRMLEIRRDRAGRAWRNAEANADMMLARAPFAGLAVIRSTFKGSQMADLQEGDEIYAGAPIVDVVDPARMQVRVRISQIDGGFVAVGQPARIQLDAYPELSFDGRVEQLAPLASPSSLTPRVRMFTAVVAIAGAHARLMPDLSAAVDISVERQENVLVLPRTAVAFDREGAWVELLGSGGERRHAVTLGSIGTDQVVVTKGLDAGAVVARRVDGGGR